jgi:3D (Asp-Asp-Asp) domain-containing protein
MRFKIVAILTVFVGYTALTTGTAAASTLDKALWVPVAKPATAYTALNNPLLTDQASVQVTKTTFTANLSAYTAAADECGKSDGITASGKKVTPKRTLACPKSYAMGTKVYIEGMGEYTCEDRGGAIKGNKFDIYVATKAEAFAFGRQNLSVTVIQ